MPRPTFKDVNANLQNWDAANRDNWTNVSGRPLALVEIPVGTNLNIAFPPTQYERCLANRENPGGTWKLIWSDGSNWREVSVGGVVS